MGKITKLLLLLLLMLTTPAFAAERTHSIVPTDESIDDATAKHVLAQIYSRNKHTYELALELYNELLDRRSEYAPSSEQLLQGPYDFSVVPQGSEVSLFDVQRTLAEIYKSDEATYQKALDHYSELLEERPGDPSYLLEMAEIYAYQKDYSRALELVCGIDIDTENIELNLKLAEVQSILGYAVESRERFLNLLSQVGDSPKLSLAYASAAMRWGDYYEALELYSCASWSSEYAVESMLGKIDVLVATQQLLEAEAQIEIDLNEYPDKREILLLKLLNIKRMRYDYQAALDIIDELLCASPKAAFKMIKVSLLNDSRAFQEALDLSLEMVDDAYYRFKAFLEAGKASLGLGECEAAHDYFQLAQEGSLVKIPATYYLADCAASDEYYIQSIIENAGSAQELLEWVYLYAKDANEYAMLKLLYAATEMDPDYFPAQLELAEACSVQMNYAAASAIYAKWLVELPENCKLLLSLARVTAWNRQYCDAVILYQDLIGMNPCDPIPRLEQARTAYWGKNYSLSMLYYRTLKEMLDDLCIGEERAYHVCLEVACRRAEWQHRFFERWEILAMLLEQDPHSPIWRFEYAENLCAFNYCEAACGMCCDVLQDIPLHTLASYSLDRGIQKQQNKVNIAYNYWQEIGYGDLSQIGRYEEICTLEVPFCCNNVFLLSQHFWDEHTFYDNRFHSANGVSAMWKYEPAPFLAIRTEAQFKAYQQDFDDTFTGNIEMNTKFLDIHKWILGASVKDMIYNYFNLAQKTQGYICYTGLESRWSHYSNAHCLFENTIYSDSNNMQRAVVDYEYRIGDYPRVLSISTLGEFRNTSHINVFINNPQGSLVDIIHPYWAPQNYYFGRVAFAFRHDYGDLAFCNAPERYYDVDFSFGTDSEDNNFCALKGQWVHECFDGWKFSISGLVHRSEMWNAKGLWCSLGYNF